MKRKELTMSFFDFYKNLIINVTEKKKMNYFSVTFLSLSHGSFTVLFHSCPFFTEGLFTYTLIPLIISNIKGGQFFAILFYFTLFACAATSVVSGYLYFNPVNEFVCLVVSLPSCYKLPLYYLKSIFSV